VIVPALEERFVRGLRRDGAHRDHGLVAVDAGLSGGQIVDVPGHDELDDSVKVVAHAEIVGEIVQGIVNHRRNLLFCVFGVGHQLFDAGDDAAQILQIGRDDDLGGLAVGDLGQRFQTAQGKDLIGGHGFVQQADGVGVGLLDGEDGLRLALGLKDALLFDGVGAEDGGGAMGWMEAGVIVPWQMYQQYGDVRILEQHYASMVAYMDYLERRAVRYVQPFGGFGDWLAIEPTNSMLTNTAYSAYDALIMEQVAKRLGKDADQRRFRTFYENVKRSFNDLFVNEEGRTFAPTVESIFGKDSQVGMWPGTAATEAKIVDTQTSYVVPLQFDLFNEKNKPLAIRHLVENIKKHNYTLTTGFIGTPYLNLVLSDNGYDDVAYKLFEQTAYPSWLYPVLQGATTIWERWNSYTLVNGFGPVDMNSFNHYSYGAIEEWMIAYTLGIQRDEEQPAYKHIILQPRIGGTFSFIRGHYDSAYGRIESGWQIQKKGYIYEATIPANTTATLYLPAKSEKSVRMEKGQEGITPVGLKDGKAVYRLGSGSYRIYVD
jgi:alpha-L-rhamnosidase